MSLTWTQICCPCPPPVSQGAGSSPLWSWVPATKALQRYCPRPEEWYPRQDTQPATPSGLSLGLYSHQEAAGISHHGQGASGYHVGCPSGFHTR